MDTKVHNKTYKYITTTLPYLNSVPHIGHCFEFVIADIIAGYNRLDSNVIFNVGVDEHGQKVHDKAVEHGYANTQDYCDAMVGRWKIFCTILNIGYDNFYRTTDSRHKENVLRFYNEIKYRIFSKEYQGNYCVGCESFVVDRDAIDGKCHIHGTVLVPTKETNRFFELSKFRDVIQDVLVDKSKSAELKNIMQDAFDLSITRQNVQWGIPTGDGDVFYVWFEALLNYIFAIRFYEDPAHFYRYWENSLIICGKDNLKFQAYILQALLLSNGVPQTKEVLVHGNILDASGAKMSKSAGNVIDPIQQVEKYGSDAVRYYLAFGLNMLDDSKYSEEALISKWNSDIVNGLGNLVSRLLHLIETRKVHLDNEGISQECTDRIEQHGNAINRCFESYDLKSAGEILNSRISYLNGRISSERPFDINCAGYVQILNEIYFELKAVTVYYGLVLKEHKHALDTAFVNNRKAIIFQRK